MSFSCQHSTHTHTHFARIDFHSVPNCVYYYVWIQAKHEMSFAMLTKKKTSDETGWHWHKGNLMRSTCAHIKYIRFAATNFNVTKCSNFDSGKNILDEVWCVMNSTKIEHTWINLKRKHEKKNTTERERLINTNFQIILFKERIVLANLRIWLIILFDDVSSRSNKLFIIKFRWILSFNINDGFIFDSQIFALISDKPK